MFFRVLNFSVGRKLSFRCITVTWELTLSLYMATCLCCSSHCLFSLNLCLSLSRPSIVPLSLSRAFPADKNSSPETFSHSPTTDLWNVPLFDECLSCSDHNGQFKRQVTRTLLIRSNVVVISAECDLKLARPSLKRLDGSTCCQNVYIYIYMYMCVCVCVCDWV